MKFPRKHYEDLGRDLGILGGSGLVLRLAMRKGVITAADVVEELGVSRPTVTQLVAPLVQAGLMTKTVTHASHGAGYRYSWRPDRAAVETTIGIILGGFAQGENSQPNLP